MNDWPWVLLALGFPAAVLAVLVIQIWDQWWRP